MTIEGFFEKYRDYFIEVYAELVGLELIKPEQILVEESNILSHLAQFTNKKLSPEERNKNLIKAEDHLIRASLDLQKLLWASLRSHLDNLIVGSPLKLLSFNLPPEEVTNKYKDFINGGRSARKNEMKNIGNDPLAAVEKYKQINSIALELLETVDITKIKIIEFELKHNIVPIRASLIELKEQLTEPEEILEIDDLHKSLVEIEDSTSKEEVRVSPAMNKTRRLLESLFNASSKMATTLNTYSKGKVLIRDITKYYIILQNGAICHNSLFDYLSATLINYFRIYILLSYLSFCSP